MVAVSGIRTQAVDKDKIIIRFGLIALIHKYCLIAIGSILE